MLGTDAVAVYGFQPNFSINRDKRRKLKLDNKIENSNNYKSLVYISFAPMNTYQTVPRTVYPRGSRNLIIYEILKPTGFPGLRPAGHPPPKIIKNRLNFALSKIPTKTVFSQTTVLKNLKNRHILQSPKYLIS